MHVGLSRGCNDLVDPTSSTDGLSCVTVPWVDIVRSARDFLHIFGFPFFVSRWFTHGLQRLAETNMGLRHVEFFFPIMVIVLAASQQTVGGATDTGKGSETERAQEICRG